MKHYAKQKDPAPKDQLLLIIASTLTLMILAMIVIAFVTGTPFDHHRSNRPWSSISALVLQTRIATVGGEEGSYEGGIILYRVEAYVSYESHGREVRRWLPASGIKSDRAYLALWLSQKKSKRCIVRWNPNNPSDIEAVLQ